MSGDRSTNSGPDDVRAVEQLVPEHAKESWAKPEIVDYQPVTVARGVQYRIGDGVNNLS